MPLCSRCKQEKPIEQFYRNKSRPNGLQAYCRSCCKAHAYVYNKALWISLTQDPSKLAEHNKLCRANNSKYAIRRRYHARLRAEVFSAYGGCCVCCREANPLFLTIDHVNNDGAAHRRKLNGSARKGNGSNMYGWARRNGFPNTLQLLCFNCNCGKQRNDGVCPHDTIN